MASRRTVIEHDKRRTSQARKRSHKETLARSQAQAVVLARLVRKAREEARAAA